MTQYQQLTHRLRFNMGPGRPDIVSERPMNRKREFLDGEEGTVVEIPAGAVGVDVAMLLRTGAIAVIEERTQVTEGTEDDDAAGP